MNARPSHPDDPFIGLCRAPAPAEDIPAWALALAARFGLDQERLEALGRRLTKSVSVGR